MEISCFRRNVRIHFRSTLLLDNQHLLLTWECMGTCHISCSPRILLKSAGSNLGSLLADACPIAYYNDIILQVHDDIQHPKDPCTRHGVHALPGLREGCIRLNSRACLLLVCLSYQLLWCIPYEPVPSGTARPSVPKPFTHESPCLTMINIWMLWLGAMGAQAAVYFLLHSPHILMICNLSI